MTRPDATQLARLTQQRLQGRSWSAIAQQYGVHRDTVKSWFRATRPALTERECRQILRLHAHGMSPHEIARLFKRRLGEVAAVWKSA